MKEFNKAIDELPFIVRLIFCLPVLDIIYVIYRMFSSIQKKDNLGIVLSIIILIVGIPWLWLLDLITIIMYNKVLWF